MILAGIAFQNRSYVFTLNASSEYLDQFFYHLSASSSGSRHELLQPLADREIEWQRAPERQIVRKSEVSIRRLQRLRGYHFLLQFAIVLSGR
jgi:hypothetical protein